MTRVTILAAVAVFGLAACDQFGGGKVEVTSNTATGNAVASNASAAAAPANAGITSSRSLAGLSGGDAGVGGKDPAAAVQAGAAQGIVDPRLVGRWTDTGDCKAVMELRPDGTFLASSGLVGTWRVDRDTLNFSANGEIMSLRIDSVEPNRIVTTNAEGNTGPSTRC